MQKHVQILGIRGLPPRHGGFETFVGRLAPYLASRGWSITVYCQQTESGSGTRKWRGVELVDIPSREGSSGSLVFDWRALGLAAGLPGPALVFGYNTAMLNERLRLHGKRTLVNMDGVEWQRAKWGKIARGWFFLNEYWATRRSTHLIADHPEIQCHLGRWRAKTPITMIPYGADVIHEADSTVLNRFELVPDGYGTIIARPEPENHVLEMVRSFSRVPRGKKLVVLGSYSQAVRYQAAVLDAASTEVVFPGAIYDPAVVGALRFHSAFYMYGHEVGGTSPTLVEALAAGSPVLCLDTPYARWVAGDAGMYFADEDECDSGIRQLFDLHPGDRSRLRERAWARHQAEFTWESVLGRYEHLLEGMLA